MVLSYAGRGVHLSPPPAVYVCRTNNQLFQRSDATVAKFIGRPSEYVQRLCCLLSALTRPRTYAAFTPVKTGRFSYSSSGADGCKPIDCIQLSRCFSLDREARGIGCASPDRNKKSVDGRDRSASLVRSEKSPCLPHQRRTHKPFSRFTLYRRTESVNETAYPWGVRRVQPSHRRGHACFA